jgi:hypothetical protein
LLRCVDLESQEQIVVIQISDDEEEHMEGGVDKDGGEEMRMLRN